MKRKDVFISIQNGIATIVELLILGFVDVCREVSLLVKQLINKLFKSKQGIKND